MIFVIGFGIGFIGSALFCTSLAQACTTRDSIDEQIAVLLKERQLRNEPPKNTFEQMTDMILNKGGDE